MSPTELAREITARWPSVQPHDGADTLLCPSNVLVDVCRWLFRDRRCGFGGLIVEERATQWELRYLFADDAAPGWTHVVVHLPLAERVVPSIAAAVHAADWYEREAEDHFGLLFEGHPRLGDFVLHDEAWQEGVEPMRHRFDVQTPETERRPQTPTGPRRIVEEPGAFVMPIGPVFAGIHEAVHFQLETVGEDVIRAFPRVFYKYRGVEKMAEGRAAADVLLLAERFSATTAFAHGLAFCHAVETVCGTDVPPRARVLRVLLAELERLRHHVGAIAGICESTGLGVAASQAAMLEEELLRITGALVGHRYGFGVVVPGGLAVDLSDAACRTAVEQTHAILRRADRLWAMLRLTSSFVDRLEEVGIIGERDARDHGLVGPIARASGIPTDLRVAQPYGAYPTLTFDVAVEREGDGYARLRVLFAEARQADRLMTQALATLQSGSVSTQVTPRAGAALGAVEAPRGAALHWVRLDDTGQVARYRILPPSFANWHGFHLAVENFAFQDLPIILATLDLSAAENDR